MEMTKTNCNKFFARFLLLITVGTGAVGYSDETVFTNNNSITNKLLSVDVFENTGKFYIKTDKETEYNFFDLKKFVNSGLFQFNQNLVIENSVPLSEGLLPERKPLEVFENKVGGRILAERTENEFGYVSISANVIKNQGNIITTNSNSILLRGQDVDLSRGVVNVKSGSDYEAGLDVNGEAKNHGILGGYLDKRFGTQFLPDWGIYDVYWDVGSIGGNPQAYGSDLGASILTPSFFPQELVSPKNLIYNNYDLYEEPMRPLRQPLDAYGRYINWSIVGATGFTRRIDRQGDVFKPYVNFERWYFGGGDSPEEHWYSQGVFLLSRNESVGVTPRIYSSDGFYGGELGPLQTTIIEIKTSVTNKVEEINETSTVYLASELGNVYPAATLITNVQSTVDRPTFMPSTTWITRKINDEFDDGVRPNSSIESYPHLGAFGGAPSAINYASYGIRFTNVLSRLHLGTETIVDIPGNVDQLGQKIGQIQPGSVIIEAENLTLEAAKIRAEGNLKIKANNLISSENAILDCQNISLDIGSTKGLLIIEDLVPDEVYRFGGSMEIYDATWTSSFVTNVVTVTDPDTDPPTIETEQRTIPWHFKMLAIDLDSSTTNQVHVQSLKLSGDDIIIRDKIRLQGELVLQSKSVTFDNDFLVIPTLNKTFRWDQTVAQGVISLTNNAVLTIPGDVEMGQPDNRYKSFSNSGTNTTQNLSIFTEYFNNSGGMHVDGSMSLDSKFVSMSDSVLDVSENSRIKANFVKLRNVTNTVGGILTLDVSDVLVDGSNNSTNLFYIGTGLESVSESSSGKLLNSQFFLEAKSYKSIPVLWNSSEDKGPSLSGYENNRAIGKLSLTNGYLGEFHFKSTKAKSAVYVDKLIFEGLTENSLATNKLDLLNIDDGVTVYFAASNLPEEKIDGMQNAKLRWVKEYAGGYSSMPLYFPGLNKSIFVNRAYRRSRIFDSDGDGIANGFDPTPFGDGRPVMTIAGRSIEWLSVPNTTYQVQYTQKLGQWANWQELGKIKSHDMLFDALRYKIPADLIPPNSGLESIYIRVVALD